MSKIETKGEFTTQFQDKQFIYFADRSKLGIVLIQRGHLIYYNKQFGKIFGYSLEEISNWKKREFYKIVHSGDLQKLVRTFKIEDNKTVVVQFRGITKEGKTIPIENSVCVVKYNDINAYLSTYIQLEKSIENNNTILRLSIDFKGELATNYKKYFEYIRKYFFITPEKYIKNITITQIESRNDDLGIF